MSMVPDEDELRRLLLAALDGDASDEQTARLNELLRTDVTIRRSAAQFLRDDSILSEEIGTLEKALAFLQQAGVALPSTGDAARDLGILPATLGEFRAPTKLGPPSMRSSLRARVSQTAGFLNSHGLAITAAAALMAVGMFWYFSGIMSELNRLQTLAAATDPEEVARQREAGGSAASPKAVPVARVTGLTDCAWPSGEKGLKFGDTLRPGERLRLTRGVLQLTYDTGAKVVVEGPVDMVMTTGVEAKLSAGKIAAAVPRFARGYTIITPTAEVVDLGTEFGVSVDNAGASEIHVFDGDVVSRPIGAHGSGSLIHARRDEAVKFGAARGQPQRIVFDGKKFVRRLIPNLPAEKLPPLPVTENLALWLAADVMPTLKDGDPVSTWPDVLVGDNHFPDDAWQFDPRLCPTFIRDGFGRPAVRFDGWSTSLATSPMETGNQQTAFVVCAPSPASFASTSHGGMLLKYGLNAPTLELTVMPDRTPRGFVWAGDESGQMSNVGEIKGKPLEPLATCAVAYTYDARLNYAELLVNGARQGAATAPRAIEQHARKYIGSHADANFGAFFLGNIYEVIVYDTGLSETDRNRVFDYLSQRYAINLGPR
jgi:anti-sigma factor RsiW